ncbi:MAG: hypothetical protein KDK66_08165 [Deltaproteobacteria bacterium]|nr:hypothetical protein [Deltaproteobacteria bacterium]
MIPIFINQGSLNPLVFGLYGSQDPCLSCETYVRSDGFVYASQMVECLYGLFFD